MNGKLQIDICDGGGSKQKISSSFSQIKYCCLTFSYHLKLQRSSRQQQAVTDREASGKASVRIAAFLNLILNLFLNLFLVLTPILILILNFILILIQWQKTESRYLSEISDRYK